MIFVYAGSRTSRFHQPRVTMDPMNERTSTVGPDGVERSEMPA
jgi:hypothetical protein